MRAAVYYANNDLRVSDVESPKPAAGEVKIRVAYAGICGSGASTSLLVLCAVQGR